jgi:hypothetical protein
MRSAEHGARAAEGTHLHRSLLLRTLLVKAGPGSSDILQGILLRMPDAYKQADRVEKRGLGKDHGGKNGQRAAKDENKLAGKVERGLRKS